jgi:hypothetical protein
MEGPFTRRGFLERSGAAALTAAGVYQLVDGIAAAPARAAAASLAQPREQHLLRGVRVVTDNRIRLLVPPLHHQVVTGNLRLAGGKAELLAARRELEAALAGLDRRFAPTPAGLGVVVAWGNPYFRDHVPALADGRSYPDYLPLDRRASEAAGQRVPALLDSLRFPSDPDDLVLEANDVCFLLRSDSLEHINAGARAIFQKLDGMFDLTSIRKGFVGGGLPKRMAMKAGIPGADSIPDTAQLFLGFTSTQQAALGPGRIANVEALPGLTDQWPDGYFRYGTTMHLSHLFEDLVTWYDHFTYQRRVWAAFRPGLELDEGVQTVPEGQDDLQSERDTLRDGIDQGVTGHSGSLQPATRLAEKVVDNYGVRNAQGTAVIQRADFNTLDNPFFWSSRPRRDRQSKAPAAGLHFVSFAATSDSFHRARLAMDGRYPDGQNVELDPDSEAQGFNAIIRTTHRQNFLVPPRRHRSFPLAELT